MRHILSFIIILVCVCSCSDSVQPSKPETYLGTKLVINKQLAKLSSSNQRIVVFFDLKECSSCKIKELQFWDCFFFSLSEKHLDDKDVDIIFVVNAQENDELTSLFAEKNAIYPLKVYYDPDKIFESQNVIPFDEQYQCFLIDKKNRIELIGNPIYSSELSDKYLDKISK